MSIEEKIESQSRFGEKIKKWVLNHPVGLLFIAIGSLLLALGPVADSIDKAIGFRNKYFPTKSENIVANPEYLPSKQANDKLNTSSLNARTTTIRETINGQTPPSDPPKTSTRQGVSIIEAGPQPQPQPQAQAQAQAQALEQESKSAERSLQEGVQAETRIGTALALVSGQTLSNRQDAIRDIFTKLPMNLTGQEVTLLLAEETLSSRFQILGLLLNRVDNNSLSAHDIVTILGKESLSTRVEMISYLTPFMKAPFTAEEAAEILGPLELTHRLNGIKTLASKIKKPLNPQEVEKVLGNLTLSNRNSAINSLI